MSELRHAFLAERGSIPDRYIDERMTRGTLGGAQLRAAGEGSSGGIDIIDGHWAVTDVWAKLRDLFGPYMERVAAGAFGKTIDERRDQIQSLFNHGKDARFGAKPLGAFTELREDDTGLWSEVPLDPDPLHEYLAASIRSGAITGGSIMFDIIDETWRFGDETESGLDERTINEVRLYEAGPVTFPAFEATDLSVRSIDPQLAAALAPEQRPLIADLCRTTPALADRLTRTTFPDVAAGERDASRREAATSEPPIILVGTQKRRARQRRAIEIEKLRNL